MLPVGGITSSKVIKIFLTGHLFRANTLKRIPDSGRGRPKGDSCPEQMQQAP